MLVHYQTTQRGGIYSMAYRIVPSEPSDQAIDARYFHAFFRRVHRESRLSGNFTARILSQSLPIGRLVCGVMFIAAPLLPRIAGPNFYPSIAALRWLC